MFISAMDDIVVKRYNNEREAQDQIRTRFVYAPKQRVLTNLLDKAQNLQLPVIAVTNGGLTRDPNRVFNKLQGGTALVDGGTAVKRMLQPVPIDLIINMTIMTRFQRDYDQIVTNFVPYFDPYIVISWRTPGNPDYEIRSQVFWNGRIDTDYPTAASPLNSSEVARIIGTTAFTFKGWLFKAAPSKTEGTIFNITADYSLTPGLTTPYSLDQLDSALTDRRTLSALPQPEVIA